LRLTFEERHNPLWVKLAEHLQSEIERLRVKNDKDMDAVLTANVRGRIAILKELLALAEDRVEVTDE
jgi:hypothetical protein